MAETVGVWGEKIIIPDTAPETKTEAAEIVAETVDKPKETTEVETVETEMTTTEPKVIEKIVEVIKEVEKPHTFANDAARELYERLVEGDETAVKNYLDEKHRDYDKMSDMDAIKWSLKKDNPEWNDSRIELQLKREYGKTFEKKPTDGLFGEELDKANDFNEAIDDAIERLQADSFDARLKLNKQKQTIELPKITRQEQAPVATKQPTAEEIQAQKQAWEDYAEAETKKMTSFKWDVEGEEVSYKITEDEVNKSVSDMKGYNAAADLTEMGWRDKDGVLFPEKIAKDRYLLKNIDKIIKSAYSQGKTAGQKETVKDIKNLNINPQSTSVAPTAVDAWQRASQILNRT